MRDFKFRAKKIKEKQSEWEKKIEMRRESKIRLALFNSLSSEFGLRVHGFRFKDLRGRERERREREERERRER